MPTYNIVSADSHLNEPPDLFKEVPQSLRQLVPQLISTEKGDAWVLAPGTDPRLVGTSAVAGRKKTEYLSKPVTYDTMRRGSFEPEPRLEDMDIDHIDGDVLYPGIMRYMERFASGEVRLACTQTYNEWLAGFCKYKPSRLVGVGVLPLLDDEDGAAAVRTLHAARKLGLKTVFLPQKNGGMPLHHPDADKLWAVASEYEMPVSIHIQTNPFMRALPKDALKIPGTRELMPVTSLVAMSEHLTLLVFGGVFMRHPKLKIVLAEGGIGWIPSVLERMDHVFHVHTPYMGSPIKELPSETFKRHCFATFQEDRAGIRLRDMMGVDNLMWASDYPHTDTTWPESKQVIDKTFAGVPELEKRKMVCDNAVRLYGF